MSFSPKEKIGTRAALEGDRREGVWRDKKVQTGHLASCRDLVIGNFRRGQSPGTKVGGLGCLPDLPRPCFVTVSGTWPVSEPLSGSCNMIVNPECRRYKTIPNFLEKFLPAQLALYSS